MADKRRKIVLKTAVLQNGEHYEVGTQINDPKLRTAFTEALIDELVLQGVADYANGAGGEEAPEAVAEEAAGAPSLPPTPPPPATEE